MNKFEFIATGKIIVSKLVIKSYFVIDKKQLISVEQKRVVHQARFLNGENFIEDVSRETMFAFSLIASCI